MHWRNMSKSVLAPHLSPNLGRQNKGRYCINLTLSLSYQIPLFLSTSTQPCFAFSRPIIVKVSKSLPDEFFTSSATEHIITIIHILMFCRLSISPPFPMISHYFLFFMSEFGYKDVITIYCGFLQELRIVFVACSVKISTFSGSQFLL